MIEVTVLMSYTAIIIDDEKSGANVLRLLLEKYLPSIQIKAICHSISEGQHAITAYRPDIVFLDIKMPNGNGFDLLDTFDKIDFAIIFVTAYDEYALRALKLRAVDYLLKPVNRVDLELAMHKAIELLPFIRNNEYYYPKNHTSGDVFVLNKYKNSFVFLDDIIYITADSNYSTLFCHQQKRHITSKTLKDIEEVLCGNSHHFIRIHKSVIVNTRHMLSYKQYGESLVVCMPNGAEFEVAQRKRMEIRNILTALSKLQS